jgi:pyrroline-5-carboxylate reductase
MRPLIKSIVDNLIDRHADAGRVDLNDIAEAIDARSVSYDEVEYIVTRLEAEGLEVGEPIDASEVRVMRTVIGAARTLRSSLNRSPTIAEISAVSGHTQQAVRRALERGRSPAVRLRYR